jgi:hypothetical protein
VDRCRTRFATGPAGLKNGGGTGLAADLLREFDRHGLLGSSLVVVGTNAMAVYEIEARVRFATAAGVDSTLNFDMTWVASETRQTTLAAVGTAPRTLLDVMKRVDLTYTVNSERSFQVATRVAMKWSFCYR